MLGGQLWISPTCSLLHCPVDLQLETRLEGEIKGWLAFSVQKLNEIVILGRGLNQGKASIQTFLQESVEVRQARQQSKRIHHPLVQERVKKINTARVPASSSLCATTIFATTLFSVAATADHYHRLIPPNNRDSQSQSCFQKRRALPFGLSGGHAR
ncbi:MULTISPECIES: hypothetical protein [Nitrosomonas]|uniref:hypothetical protein n=1 Tax=Nitrosomonas TaxID=914 RepID=UPI000AEF38F6|nr:MULTISPECIES: hypothetical protein [Nitrosomonas]UVS63511.1 hypothetical protein NX761_06330 [Nitrosomonas sp. PLL12]